MEKLSSVTGWRVFSVGDAGELVPPFTRNYWPAAGPACGPWGRWWADRGMDGAGLLRGRR